jgi:hypothetical protein
MLLWNFSPKYPHKSNRPRLHSRQVVYIVDDSTTMLFSFREENANHPHLFIRLFREKRFRVGL